MTTAAAGMPGSPVAGAGAGAPEVAARDAAIGWFRGEFAAANAMIDMLCGHLAQIGGGAEYEPVFAALHRRRLNWFPVLHMQKFYPVADVATELRRVAEARAAAAGSCCYSEEAASTVVHEPMDDLPADPEPAEQEPTEQERDQDPVQQQDPAPVAEETDHAEEPDPDAEVDSSGDSSERKAASTEDDTVADGHHTDQGSQGEHSLPESYPICSDHEECIVRPERIKIQKGFVAKESVKGHMASSIFTQLGKLSVLKG